MNILILGGTRFLGRHLVEVCEKRGHTVTLFNRGKSGNTVFPNVETIVGDRLKDTDLLKGRTWDCVIDTCGYTPNDVTLTAEALKDTVQNYIYISSISVYENPDNEPIGFTEDIPLNQITDEQLDKVNKLKRGEGSSAATFMELYGPLKAASEKAVQEVMDGKSLILRPGLLVGPYDYTERFSYWLKRVEKGGVMLAPPKDRPIRFVDTKDFSTWIITIAENNTHGVYHVGGKPEVTFGELIETAIEYSKSDVQVVWADEEFLQKENVQPWGDLPIWLPKGMDGLFYMSDNHAVEMGMKYSPVKETIEKTYQWIHEGKENIVMKTALSSEREAELIGKYHNPA